MNIEIDNFINSLTAQIGKGGNDPLIRNALVLLDMAKRNGYNVDTKLGANCPTFRDSANMALLTVPGFSETPNAVLSGKPPHNEL